MNSADLNNPPTAVGGIGTAGVWICRKDLNDPPTAVGGIRTLGVWMLEGLERSAHCRGRDSNSWGVDIGRT